METKHYYATKESLYIGIIQATFISLILSFLIVGFIVGSFSYNILFYISLFVAIFYICALTLSPISGYYTSISEKELIISSFKSMNIKKFEWDKISAVNVGVVYNKYSRYNSSYYGVEILAENEFKNLTATYKLIHLKDHEVLMDEIMELCKLKDIKHADLRNVSLLK